MGANLSVAAARQHRVPLLLTGGTVATIALRNHTPGLLVYIILRAVLTPWIRLARRIRTGQPLQQGPRDELLAAMMRYGIGRLPLPELRWLLTSIVRLVKLIHRPITIAVNEPKCKGLWYGNAPLDQDCVVVFYVHGGGYCFGSADQYPYALMNIVRRLQACGGGARVLSVDYGLSPEYPYPTALNQVIQAYDWLVNDQHVAPSRIVIAGDSAGGALALLLACSLRDRQQAPTAGLALISPWVDFNGDDAYIRNGSTDILPNAIGHLTPKYLPPLPPDSKVNYAAASPLNADLRALPPMCVMRGTLEIFDDAIKSFVIRARDSGAAVTEIVGEGMFHIFPLFADLGSKGCRTGLRLLSTYIAERLRPHTPAVVHAAVH